MGSKLTDQSRRVLENYLDRWDHTNLQNPHHAAATTREVARNVWRIFCNAIFDLRQIYARRPERPPTRPDARSVPVEETPELEEFLTLL